MTKSSIGESQRILAEYERRDRVLPRDYYGLHHLPNLFRHQEHERTLVRCLQHSRQIPFTDKHILDVGCGEGDWLRVFESLAQVSSFLRESNSDRTVPRRHASGCPKPIFALAMPRLCPGPTKASMWCSSE